MEMDVLAAGIGLLSFGMFLLVQCIIFRRVAPHRLLQSLLVCVISILGVPVLLMGICFLFQVVQASIAIWVCAGILASLVQGLLSFVYVLCVFGPYETSVRMRLVREIAAVSRQGVSWEELLQRYNEESIVKIRLQRLLGSGDIIEKNGYYRIGRRHNFFFLFDAIAGVIKGWIEA